MRRRHSGRLLLVIAGSLQLAHAQDTQCLHKNHAPATVRIDYEYKTEKDGKGNEAGTGFLVTSSGYILTNAHVVTPKLKTAKVVSSSINVRVGGLQADPVNATVREEDIDESSDLALIKIAPIQAANGWPTLPISYVDTLPVGSPLTGLGFASGGDIAIVPTGQKRPKVPWWTTSQKRGGKQVWL